MADPVRIERDPAASETVPTLEIQASAKGLDRWRLSYRDWGSGSTWNYLTADDVLIDDVLDAAGFRRVEV